MSQFDDREKAFETKFKQDEELRFRVMARRNKKLGLWAAEKLGLSGAMADAYAKDVVVSDFEAPGDDDVLAKVAGDLRAKSIDISDHMVRVEMDRLLEVAREEIMQETA